ncbi:MAG: quinolinate synthase NadA [Methanolinea sp.]|nr:quinolinate synthase NadA [Methanolinea sp.]
MRLDERIRELKVQKKAIILAHNYQRPEIQDLADFVGDSLELAKNARNATAPLIVFCGVLFMAETAKILNPDRKVLIPVRDAACPLADQLTPGMLLEAKRAHPTAPVVLYINSTAACKALADIICTSANAVEVVRSLPDRQVIVGPDANLAAYIQSRLPEKEIIPIPPAGHCYVHECFTRDDVLVARERGDRVLCHPECRPEVQAEADIVVSTGGMVKALRGHPPGSRWTILTEREMAFRLKTLYPDQVVHAREDAVCRDMKKITLPDLLRSLEKEQYEVIVPAEIMEKARRAIERMLVIGR